MKEKEVLGGFSALFDEMLPNEPHNREIKGVELIGGSEDDGDNTIGLNQDDDDIQQSLFHEDENEDENQDENEKTDDKDDDTENQNDANQDDNESEKETVSAFFDALAETIGWNDVEEDEKPKSIEDLVEYMKGAIEESSKPSYANDDVAALDEYVRNGGSIKDYIGSVDSDIDYDSIDISDVKTQKRIVSEFLSEKGFSESQIKRKIEKYEDADLLEDEATDAIDYLKESKEEKRKALLEEQKNAKENMVKEQQRFYNNVVSEIEALNDIRGIKIPKQDKSKLMDYIFAVEPDGKTKYQKEYASKTKNLIESAYFTMKGDSLIENARRSGETTSVDRLRKTLNSTKIGGSKQTINTGSPEPLWSMTSKQLLNRPK